MIPTETAESLGDTRCQLKASPDICIERERDLEWSARSADAIAKNGGTHRLSSWLHLSVRCQAQRREARSPGSA